MLQKIQSKKIIVLHIAHNTELFDQIQAGLFQRFSVDCVFLNVETVTFCLIEKKMCPCLVSFALFQ